MQCETSAKRRQASSATGSSALLEQLIQTGQQTVESDSNFPLDAVRLWDLNANRPQYTKCSTVSACIIQQHGLLCSAQACQEMARWVCQAAS